jgi:hypothetical protein
MLHFAGKSPYQASAFGRKGAALKRPLLAASGHFQDIAMNIGSR